MIGTLAALRHLPFGIYTALQNHPKLRPHLIWVLVLVADTAQNCEQLRHALFIGRLA